MNLEQLLRSSSAVLFDFDGVLADSEPYYRKSWNMVLSDFGHTVTEADYWKHWAFLGEGLEGEIKRSGLVIPSIEKAKAYQKAIYRDFCVTGHIPLFPGAPAVLRKVMLKKNCAIASNTASDLIRAITRREIRKMPPVVGGEGLRSKPAPDIFLRAAESLHVFPEECLVFEDAMKGIQAGNSAGMKVVLVRNRYNEGLDGTGAVCEVSGLESIIEAAEAL